jgi:quercetin dioxygenase-like cupin family protein
MKETKTIQNQNPVKYVPAGTGPMYWGPGDRVTFLVTGAQSGGACFICEVLVPPGGGPPPHLHHLEEESFYLLEGALTIRAAGRTYQASAGDFIHIPRRTAHSFKNDGKVDARMVVTVSPAGPTGLEKFFQEAFCPATECSSLLPHTEDLMTRIKTAFAKNGLEFVPQA